MKYIKALSVTSRSKITLCDSFIFFCARLLKGFELMRRLLHLRVPCTLSIYDVLFKMWNLTCGKKKDSSLGTVEAGERMTNVERVVWRHPYALLNEVISLNSFILILEFSGCLHWSVSFFLLLFFQQCICPLIPGLFSGSHFVYFFFFFFSISRVLNRRAYTLVRILARFCPRCQQ